MAENRSMNPWEFAFEMRSICDEYKGDMDTEMRHIKMDQLMCQVLTDLGYAEGVKVFKEADKWYA